MAAFVLPLRPFATPAPFLYDDPCTLTDRLIIITYFFSFCKVEAKDKALQAAHARHREAQAQVAELQQELDNNTGVCKSINGCCSPSIPMANASSFGPSQAATHTDSPPVCASSPAPPPVVFRVHYQELITRNEEIERLRNLVEEQGALIMNLQQQLSSQHGGQQQPAAVAQPQQPPPPPPLQAPQELPHRASQQQGAVPQPPPPPPEQPSYGWGPHSTSGQQEAGHSGQAANQTAVSSGQEEGAGGGRMGVEEGEQRAATTSTGGVWPTSHPSRQSQAQEEGTHNQRQSESGHVAQLGHSQTTPSSQSLVWESEDERDPGRAPSLGPHTQGVEGGIGSGGQAQQGVHAQPGRHAQQGMGADRLVVEESGGGLLDLEFGAADDGDLI